MMRFLKRSIHGLVWVGLALLVSTSLALAQGYGITKGTVDGGGGVVQTGSGQFSLSDSIAQPDAGVLSDNSGTYSLVGGYWDGVTIESSPGNATEVYLPVILHN
jgi:hypothetical protein